MSAGLIGVLLAVLGFVIIGAYRVGKNVGHEEGMKAENARLRALVEADEAEEAPKPAKLPSQPEKKYQPKGQKMPKPVFLPTEADSLLEEDPVVAWAPVAIIDEDGIIDWDKTEANAVYANPKTGELIEYGHK